MVVHYFVHNALACIPIKAWMAGQSLTAIWTCNTKMLNFFLKQNCSSYGTYL